MQKIVVPKLHAAGWDNDPYSIAEQRTITDGRIVPMAKALFADHRSGLIICFDTGEIFRSRLLKRNRNWKQWEDTL